MTNERRADVAGRIALVAVTAAVVLLACAIPAAVLDLRGVVRVLLIAAGVAFVLAVILIVVMVVSAPPVRRKS